MQVRWKKLMTQATLWLMAEVVLSVMGLDDLADYSEYYFGATRMMPRHHLVISIQSSMTGIVLSRP